MSTQTSTRLIHSEARLLTIDDSQRLSVLHLLQPMWPDLLLAAKLSSDQDFERGLQVWLLILRDCVLKDGDRSRRKIEGEGRVGKGSDV